MSGGGVLHTAVPVSKSRCVDSVTLQILYLRLSCPYAGAIGFDRPCRIAGIKRQPDAIFLQLGVHQVRSLADERRHLTRSSSRATKPGLKYVKLTSQITYSDSNGNTHMIAETRSSSTGVLMLKLSSSMTTVLLNLMVFSFICSTNKRPNELF